MAIHNTVIEISDTYITVCIPQDSLLGHTLFLLCNKDLPKNFLSSHSQIAEESTVYVNTPNNLDDQNLVDDLSLDLAGTAHKDDNCFVTYNNYKTKPVKFHYHRADPGYFFPVMMKGFTFIVAPCLSGHKLTPNLKWNSYIRPIAKDAGKQDALSHVPLEKVPDLRPRTISRRAGPDQKLTIALHLTRISLILTFQSRPCSKAFERVTKFFFNPSFPQTLLVSRYSTAISIADVRVNCIP